jgi:hypothetical protein
MACGWTAQGNAVAIGPVDPDNGIENPTGA